MKKLILLLSVAFANFPLWAQTTTPNVAPLPLVPKKAPNMATVTPFITGLKEPQGLSWSGSAGAALLVCDYGTGEVLKFDLDGKQQGVLATGLKGPSQITSGGRLIKEPNIYESVIYVTESGANQVTAIDQKGTTTRHGKEIPGALGLVNTTSGMLTVSHSTSSLYRFDPKLEFDPKLKKDNITHNWELVYSAPAATGVRQGFGCIDSTGSGYLLCDEAGQRILMLTGSGQVATFASGISHPAGIKIWPDGMVYVANEGDGGQLIRINAEGVKTVVAENLGRPHSILYFGEKTALVSNRDGNVWQVELP